MTGDTDISVVLIGYETAADCRMVVGELVRQTRRAEIEIVMVAPDREGIHQQDVVRFGAWNWVHLPKVRTCGGAFAEGVRAASSPLVTYAEEHTYLNDDWAERLIAAHGSQNDVVGFAMENANPETLTSWAHLYGQFGPVVAPVNSGEGGFLAGHHVSYRRELLLDYGDLLDEVLEDEAALFLDLRSKGIRMYIAGDAISKHVNISNLTAYMKMDYLGQRSFAATRAKAGKWSRSRRLAYASAFPLIPMVRMRRIVRDIRRTGRQEELLPEILLPIGLALAAGSVGEMVGYLLGSGRAAEKKAPAELKREEFLSKQDPWTKDKPVRESV